MVSRKKRNKSALRRKSAFFSLSKKAKRKLIRYSFITANIVIISVAVGVAYIYFKPDQSGILSNMGSIASKTTSDMAPANPLDKVSSVDIALQVARSAGMQEQIAVMNSSDSERTNIALSETVNSVISYKPQIVTTSFVSGKDIKKYTVKSGDSVASIAEAFGISSDSIRWSNNIVGDNLSVGTILNIPPMNGIAYKVKRGDTAKSLASYYNSNEQKIITYNDAEIDGLIENSIILIPDGKKPSPRSYSYGGYYGFAFGSSPIYGYNGYAPGYCTYYVASRISVPTNWGDAVNWARGATLSGWTVSRVPRPGSIAQTAGMDRYGRGHVAYVEAVSPDGQTITISDMNFGGRWKIRRNVQMPTSSFQAYIYR